MKTINAKLFKTLRGKLNCLNFDISLENKDAIKIAKYIEAKDIYVNDVENDSITFNEFNRISELKSIISIFADLNYDLKIKIMN